MLFHTKWNNNIFIHLMENCYGRTSIMDEQPLLINILLEWTTITDEQHLSTNKHYVPTTEELPLWRNNHYGLLRSVSCFNFSDLDLTQNTIKYENNKKHKTAFIIRLEQK